MEWQDLIYILTGSCYWCEYRVESGKEQTQPTGEMASPMSRVSNHGGSERSGGRVQWSDSGSLLEIKQMALTPFRGEEVKDGEIL